ncbi:heterokaryon incompatibility protein [Fusarium mundagurra]|uniref:Heterokaryon incompatibility protein n=1 Tax=Fusarium mundagurra TaxID=1567541 RepID=A0A8H5Z8X1_9HYPO|nr:heterokaryon incompatibility protein [Fusarium mundagurra]
MEKRFHYTSLPDHHIRLLKLTKCSDVSGRIAFDFLPISLETLNSAYTALSYSWGSDIKTDRIWHEDSYLDITASAMAIVSAVSKQTNPPYIWIDALCIDQCNMAEKNIQVRLMNKIYARANKVVAWLPYTPERSQVTNFIDTLHGAITNLFRQKLPITFQSLIASTGCQDHSSWFQFAKFLEDPWFNRVWIVQEMVVPNEINIICGRTMVPWKALADVLSIIQGNGLQRLLVPLVEGVEMNPPSGLEAMVRNYAIHTLFQTKQPRLLSSLLIDCWKCGATDGRDKLFALVGIASDAGDAEFVPDYDVPEATVFERATARLLSRDPDSNRILHAAGLGLRRQPSPLPSWVPVWTDPFLNTIFGNITTAGYCASGDTSTSHQPFYDQNNHTLTISGHLVDTIKTIADPFPSAVWHDTREGLQSKAAAELAWISQIRQIYPQNTYPETEHPFFPHVLAFSLIANMIHPGIAAPQVYADYFDQFIKYKTWTSTATVTEWNSHKYSAAQLFGASSYATAMSISQQRPFFVSENLYCGLGVPGVQVGDRICVFQGFITPFILRPQLTGVYSLVGECYIYGLMNREGLSQGIEQDIILA